MISPSPSRDPAQTGAAGWTVKDVFTHFGDLLGILASAIQGTLDTDLGIERLNDAHVAAKSAWSPGQVTADLDRQAALVLPMLESLQEEPNASTQAQLLDLGSYPLHAIPDMFAFDFYTHLRWNVLAPRGPLTGHDVPKPDEVRLAPAVGWLLAGIPKRQAGIRDSLAKPVTLALTGPGGGEHPPALAGAGDRDRRRADRGELPRRPQPGVRHENPRPAPERGQVIRTRAAANRGAITFRMRRCERGGPNAADADLPPRDCRCSSCRSDPSQ